MKFDFIKSSRSSYSVKKMCHAFSVSVSGYYDWRRRPLSKRKIQNQHLCERICELYDAHNGMVGSPMITADVREESDFFNVSRPRIARLMRSMGLSCRSKKKFKVTTDSKHSEPVAPNILNREFSAPAPDKVYVSDITYLPVGNKWYYLTVVIDLFSRLVVGWELSDSLERFSVMSALNKAIIKRSPLPGLIFHSDRGVQYASEDFRNMLNRHDFIQSMSRKGNCWDNAVSESFFGTLKTQLIYHYKFNSYDELNRALFYYIEVYYNRRRKHSTNGYKSPSQFELEWHNKNMADTA